MQNLCRLCALEKTYRIPIFTETNTGIASRIEQLVQVRVFESDDLPKTVCNECFVHLNSYGDFIAKCQQAQHLLRTLCQNGVSLPSNNALNPSPNTLDPVIIKSETDILSPAHEIEYSDDSIKEQKEFVEIEVLSERNLACNEDDCDTEHIEKDNRVDFVPREQGSSFQSNAPQLLPFSKWSTAQHSQKRKSRMLFRELLCCECDAVTKGSKQLELHFLTKHGRSVIYLCPVCAKRFEKYRSFTRHVILHEDGPKYTCEICDRTFGQKVNLENHFKTHTNEFQYECKQCGRRYRHITSLYRHIPNHESAGCTCGICLQSFKSEEVLREHSCGNDGVVNGDGNKCKSVENVDSI